MDVRGADVMAWFACPHGAVALVTATPRLWSACPFSRKPFRVALSDSQIEQKTRGRCDCKFLPHRLLGNAGHLVGQGHGGPVVAGAGLKAQQPYA